MDKMNEALNKKSMDYIPTYQEIGYSDQEMENLNFDLEHVRNEWERRINVFQRKHREKLMERESLKKNRKIKEMASHWYVRLNESEITALIEKSRSLADDVIDSLNSGSKPKSIYNYYESLRNKVKTSKAIIVACEEKKLERFPKLNESTKQLYGSAYSFSKLWAHVFSTKNSKRKGQFST